MRLFTIRQGPKEWYSLVLYYPIKSSLLSSLHNGDDGDWTESESESNKAGTYGGNPIIVYQAESVLYQHPFFTFTFPFQEEGRRGFWLDFHPFYFFHYFPSWYFNHKKERRGSSLCRNNTISCNVGLTGFDLFSCFIPSAQRWCMVVTFAGGMWHLPYLFIVAWEVVKGVEDSALRHHHYQGREREFKGLWLRWWILWLPWLYEHIANGPVTWHLRSSVNVNVNAISGCYLLQPSSLRITLLLLLLFLPFPSRGRNSLEMHCSPAGWQARRVEFYSRNFHFWLVFHRESHQLSCHFSPVPWCESWKLEVGRKEV